MKRCLKIFGICLVALSASLYAQESEENFDDELLLEGEGLTIIRNAERQESKSGVSVVLSKEQMDTTARSGMVEDVMSSVSTLPGITFGGQWNKEPFYWIHKQRKMKHKPGALQGCVCRLQECYRSRSYWTQYKRQGL